MLDGQAQGMQQMAADMLRIPVQNESHGTAIEEITEQRVALPRQVRTNLVGATGFGTGFDQGEAWADRKGAKGGFRPVAAAANRYGTPTNPGFEKITDRELLRRRTGDQGQVGFSYLPLGKLSGQVAVGLGTQGEQEHAGGINIQAVQQNRLQIRASPAHQVEGIDPSVHQGMRRQASRLVDRQQMFVAKKDFELCDVQARRLSLEGQGDRFAALEQQVGPALDPAIDKDPPAVERPLYLFARHPCEMIDDKAVKPLPLHFAAGDQGLTADRTVAHASSPVSSPSDQPLIFTATRCPCSASSPGNLTER